LGFRVRSAACCRQYPPRDYQEKSGTLRFGPYEIKLLPDGIDNDTPGVTVIRANEMLINYVGTAKSFKYYSFADVLDGKVSSREFDGKIVLVGATSPTLGDTQVTPFMHYPSVKVIRKAGRRCRALRFTQYYHTVMNRLWLSSPPPFAEFGLAILVILLVTVAVNYLKAGKQLLVLTAIVAAIHLQ